MTSTTKFESRISGQGVVAEEVTAHLGGPATSMSILTQKFEFFDLVRVQSALDHYQLSHGASVPARGLNNPNSEDELDWMSLSDSRLAYLLVSPDTTFGAPRFERVDFGPDDSRPALYSGVLFLRGPEGPLLVHVHGQGLMREVFLSIVAPSAGAAASFLTRLRALMKEHNPWRGKYIRFVQDAHERINIAFLPKPHIEREELILPAAALNTIEAHAIGIGERAAALSQMRQHLKRGLLLYGPPGTGKTHTVRYIASRLPEATLIVLTGSAMAWLSYIKPFLADLAPLIVVFDDVDLIAEDRSLPGMAPRDMLFTLLDTMDGLSEDSDILFVCTSNSLDTLESAVAQRPGRIDVSVEVGLPDRECRHRLLDLALRGLTTMIVDKESVLDRTEGVTASFMKEMVRRAFLSSRAENAVFVTDSHLHLALDEMLDPENPLLPALLGAAEPRVLERHNERGVGRQWC